MPPIYKGQSAVSTPEFSFRQDDGLHFAYRERGIPAHIIGRANGWKRNGYDVHVFRNGPYAELSASKTRVWPTGGYSYIELWGVASEIVEKSLFSLPAVFAEAGTFPAPGGRAGYKKKIEDAVSKREALAVADFPTATFPQAHVIHQELMRGVQTYEFEYTILTRTVNFAFETPPQPLVLLSNRYIMSTAQLLSWYGVPVSVKFELPVDPASQPAHTMWGWRVRDQSAEITNATTGQHRTSWVYAAWSTFLYTVATGKPNV